jgi:hypothetical protein
MKNKVNFGDEWNLLNIDGIRQIHRDDIEHIKLSDSGNSYLVKLKKETCVFSFSVNKCSFYVQ